MRWIQVLALSVIFNLLHTVLHAQQSDNEFQKYEELIPRHLLSLVHAPEVHEELQLSADQVRELEALFTEIDSQWFPARILTFKFQRPIVIQLEQRIYQWFDDNTSDKQVQRLRQLEYQSQSVRMLLRDDISKKLKLKKEQLEKLAKLAEQTKEAQQQLQTANRTGGDIKKLAADVQKAAQAEKDEMQKSLSEEQHQKIWKLLGEPFETNKLKRIYPMAPEFVAVEDWINSSPLAMKDLRGKVVLVHFYAFQCHNCHANFNIYRRWHEQLREKGVVVVGIQTPETAAERNPAQVEAAAKEKNLNFPILVDLESKNWKAWGNTMWPTVYVVDKNGYIRHWWQGELNWKGATGDKTIEQVVEAALAEKTS